MKYSYRFLCLLLLSSICMPTHAQDSTTNIISDSLLLEQLFAHIDEARRQDSLLNYQYGSINLDGLATLELDSTYKYLNPTETKKILEEAWGNPPQETLGMVFPDSVNPYMYNGWGIIVSYTEDGYIPDEDAEGIDYDEIMDEMKAGAKEASKARIELGYEAYEIIGWADNPHYDKAEKKLYWAQEAHFDGSDDNTLNYDIRILGRKGYISMNAVASMDQIDMVKSNMQTLIPKVSFQEGNTYHEFNPEVDQVAAYGFGALVAGKVAAKAGFFKLVGIFLAKAWKFILIGIAGLAGFLKRIFSGGDANAKRELDA